ncbi:MAG: 3-hydroxybutyryl-CoA dehydrogenase [Chloroflexi bacterium]|nr:3-hydroxybutyryl-CoA dehydrogenase [Chloroflexota bacterium]
MEFRQVGIVGFGTMGTGIAHLCAREGHQTLVMARTEARQGRGIAAIRGFLNRDVQAGVRTAEDVEAIIGRISFTSNYEDLGSCDFIIEAVSENVDVKREVYPILDRVAAPDAVIASNTSSVPIIEMAATTTRPERVVGLHFFNPAPVMRAVEVIRPITASEDAIERARAFGESLNKTVLMCQDMPGFLINRLLWPYLLDAIRLFENGLASRDDIDNGMRLGCNHPMGPLQLADLLGLDVLMRAADVFYNELRDTRFSAPPLLRRMVLAGQLGRKTGKGFYDYSAR